MMNVTEDKDTYYVRAELPGMKAEELVISVTGNSVSISGEKALRRRRQGPVSPQGERRGHSTGS